jgi:hypothetical protein
VAQAARAAQAVPVAVVAKVVVVQAVRVAVVAKVAVVQGKVAVDLPEVAADAVS